MIVRPGSSNRCICSGSTNLRHHARISFARRRLLVRVSHAEPAAEIQILQQNSVTCAIRKHKIASRCNARRNGSSDTICDPM